MRNQSLSTGLKLLSLIVITFVMSGPAFAQTETVLYNFSPNSGGSGPASSLIFDSAGNLYGTTQGPFSDQGVAFQLKPKTGGTWSQSVMHTFGGTGDGASPSGPLVFDSAGNFYGTTSGGGAYGFGTVFEIKPTKTGYVEHVLHSFGSGNDGATPFGGVILDSTGNLYGTTLAGGSNFCAFSQTNCGTVFELARNTNGGYSEKILHNFAEVGDTDGYEPNGTLTFDRAGHLYGTTLFGGSGFQGTVFELIQKANGQWGEKIVHNFAADGTDGERPYSGVTIDATGNLYGTTNNGGAASLLGTVYELSPGAGGTWTETIIHAFAEDNVDGFLPQSGVILDSAGNVYGTTVAGGAADLGVVFELSPAGGGVWTETLLFTFTVVPPGNVDGANPEAGLIFNGAGNLYGTTYGGGEFSGGIAFEITP